MQARARILAGAGLAAIVGVSSPAQAWETNVPAVYDVGMYDANGDGVAAAQRKGGFFYVGDYDVSPSTVLDKGYVIFQLPPLGENETVQAAKLRLFHDSNYAVETNAALYHLRDFNETDLSYTAFNAKPATLVDQNFLTPNAGPNAIVKKSVEADVTDCVRSDYDHDPIAKPRSAFRIELYSYPASGNGNNTANRYVVGTMERASAAERPCLVLEIGPRAPAPANGARPSGVSIQDK